MLDTTARGVLAMLKGMMAELSESHSLTLVQKEREADPRRPKMTR